MEIEDVESDEDGHWITTGEDDLVPPGSDLLRCHVDRGQTGGTETVDLHTRDGVGHLGGQRGDPRQVHALIPRRGDDPVDDVGDPVLVEIGEAPPHLLDEADDQVDRLDPVQSAARLALASRSPDGVVDECLGHGWSTAFLWAS